MTKTPIKEDYKPKIKINICVGKHPYEIVIQDAAISKNKIDRIEAFLHKEFKDEK